MKIGVLSLGCAKNLVDTEIVLGFLTKAGHTIVADPGAAELIIVNTCGFIQEAKEESLEAILEMANYRKTGARLLVMGCLSERYGQELWAEMPEIDGLLGVNELDLVTEAVAELSAGKRVFKKRQGFFTYNGFPRVLSTGSHFAYLKVAEGCDQHCAFCVIPKIRGKQRSRDFDSILKEARDLAAGGVQELAVIAQDTTAYGRDLGTGGIVELLEALAELDIPWIRLLYTYPSTVSDELLDLIARKPRLVKYLDLPLQHVSKSVLRRMKRPGDSAAYARLIAKARHRIPGVTMRSTFIVGFPGETEEDFNQLLRFLEEQRLERVGIFQFSREEGAAAYDYPGQIDAETKARRYAQAMELQQSIALELNQELVGRELPVLLEQVSDESDLVLLGRHSGQAPDVDGAVYVGRGDAVLGELATVRIIEARAYDLVGEVVSGSESP